MTDNNMESSVSAYVAESYEGLDTAFSEVSQLPSRGYCDLYRAKRYGRWYLLKCLKTEVRDDAAHQQMLRKELWNWPRSCLRILIRWLQLV